MIRRAICRSFVVPVSLAGLLLVLCLSAAAESRVAQAKGEGEVLWYTAMNVPDAEAVRKQFAQRHPFLALSIVRATGEKIRTRILTEARAGRFLAARDRARPRSCSASRSRSHRRLFSLRPTDARLDINPAVTNDKSPAY